MQIEFRNKALHAAYLDLAEGRKRWGQKVALKYIDRINHLKHAKRLDELFAFTQLRLHPLKGSRQGQWALDLTERWRLIITPREANDIEVIGIEEVTNHYED
jgi:toxin HigB-1